MHLLGDASSVTCTASSFHGIAGIEDVAAVQIGFRSGATASLTSIWHDIDERGSLRHVEVFCGRPSSSSPATRVGPVRYRFRRRRRGDGAGGRGGAGRGPAARRPGRQPRRVVPAVGAQGRRGRRPGDAVRAHELIDAAYRRRRRAAPSRYEPVPTGAAGGPGRRHRAIRRMRPDGDAARGPGHDPVARHPGAVGVEPPAGAVRGAARRPVGDASQVATRPGAFRAGWTEKAGAEGYGEGGRADPASPKARQAAAMTRFVEGSSRSRWWCWPCIRPCRGRHHPRRVGLPGVPEPAAGGPGPGLRRRHDHWHGAVDAELHSVLGIPADVVIAAAIPLAVGPREPRPGAAAARSPMSCSRTGGAAGRRPSTRPAPRFAGAPPAHPTP